MTCKVLLVPDVGPPRSKPWAWFYRCSDLARFAPPDYDVTVICHDDFTQQFRDHPDRLKEWDGVLSMSWTMSPLPILKHARRSVCLVTCGGLLYDRRIESDWRSRVVTASRNTRRARERLPQFDGVIAVNREVYGAAKQHNPNTVLIPSGVNTDFWSYRPPREFTPPLRVGWSGQRRCNLKGLHDILEPLMKRCPQYDWRVNDRNFNEAMTREEMRDWYSDLDVFLSTSIIEGTPSPPFEAASCGRVVLSTSVGVVADWEFLEADGLRCQSYRNAQEAVETVDWFVEQLAETERLAHQLEEVGQRLRESVASTFCYRNAGIARKYLEFVANGTQPA